MKARAEHPVAVMTVEQVADYLQLNKLTVYKYIRNGRLPASKLGKSYRIRKADVDWFLESAKMPVRGRPRAAIAPVAPGGRRSAPAERRAPRMEDVYVGPQRREGSKSPEVPSVNPMDWVIRGLH